MATSLFRRALPLLLLSGLMLGACTVHEHHDYGRHGRGYHGRPHHDYGYHRDRAYYHDRF